jgi:nitroreductase
MMEGPAHLEWLRSRRSVRSFAPRPLGRDLLERLVAAAVTAPSSTNRQPWRFAVVTAERLRRALAEAVRRRAGEMKAIIARGPHGPEFASYGDFFWEPLEAAAAIIVPQFREYPDQIAQLIESGGGDPAGWNTAASMRAELCSTSGAVMTLLLQAHAEGLGACWMAGPMVARREISALLDIREPWQMLGAVALGWPAAPPAAGPGRKAMDRVMVWFEDETGNE